MDSGTIFVSIGALNRVFIALLYLLVVVIGYRWLAPRLLPEFKVLAGVMLALTALVTFWSLEWQPASNFEHWLRVFTEEYNAPATLASIQLALIAATALFAAGPAKARSAALRAYFVAVGLVFIYFALDEYFAFHERYPYWEHQYAVVGAAIVIATIALAKRSSRRARVWHGCLLVGLALTAAGGIGLELSPKACGELGFFRFKGCLLFFYMEEALEFVGGWLVLVALLGHLSSREPIPRAGLRRFLFAFPALWLLLILLITLIPRIELRFFAQPAAVKFEPGLRLHGYRIDGALFLLYASANFEDYSGLGYSIHLVDQISGESVASLDRWASRQELFWLFGPDYAPLYRQWMQLELPPSPPVNRALWAVLTLWRRQDGEFVRQSISESDHEQLAENQLVLTELVLPAPPAVPAAAPLALFSNGFALDPVRLPDHAGRGDALDVQFTWRSGQDSDSDYAQFLHLGHKASGAWWVYDQQPLGARIPTRLWYSGLVDSETWAAPIPADLAPGEYAVYTGLYRMSDKERVPVTDEGGRPFVDARVPLGTLELRG